MLKSLGILLALAITLIISCSEEITDPDPRIGFVNFSLYGSDLFAPTLTNQTYSNLGGFQNTDETFDISQSIFYATIDRQYPRLYFHFLGNTLGSYPCTNGTSYFESTIVFRLVDDTSNAYWASPGVYSSSGLIVFTNFDKTNARGYFSAISSNYIRGNYITISGTIDSYYNPKIYN